MDNKDNELYMLKKEIEDLKRELDGLDSSIQSAGQAISDKLTECNKTFERANMPIVKSAAKAALCGAASAVLMLLSFTATAMCVVGAIKALEAML